MSSLDLMKNLDILLLLSKTKFTTQLLATPTNKEPVKSGIITYLKTYTQSDSSS